MPNASASSSAATRSSPRSIAPLAPRKSPARICCWQSVVGRIPTIWISTKPGCAATSVATSSSMTDCKPLRPASGSRGLQRQGRLHPNRVQRFRDVAANLLDQDPRRVSERITAYALYTDPPLGRVGMTLAEARNSGRRVLAGERPMTRVARAVEKGETQGFMRILVDGDSEEILGASLLGTGCDEAVHAILDLMYAKAPYTVVQRAMHIHPTVSELLPTILGDLKSVS